MHFQFGLPGSICGLMMLPQNLDKWDFSITQNTILSFQYLDRFLNIGEVLPQLKGLIREYMTRIWNVAP